MGIAVCFMKLNRIAIWEFILIVFAALVVPYFKGGFFSLSHFSVVASVFGALTALAIAFTNYTNSVFAFLGKISFSLYLLHVPIGGRILNFSGRFVTTEIAIWVSLFFALSITLIASYLFYRWVETPALLISKRIAYKSN